MSPLKTLPTISVVALTALLLLSPLAASAAGATVTVHTDQPSYFGAQSLTVFGKVSPTPTSSSFVVITVKNPSGATVLSGEGSVSTSDGSYSQGFVTGGTGNWITGTYKVNATYASGSVSGSATITFSYSSSGGGGGGISQTQFNDIIGNLTEIKTAISKLSTADQVNALTTALTQVQSSLTSIATQVTAMSNAISGINTQVAAAASAASAAQTAATNAGNAVSSTQTYVLVVAVLAAITLVLELAILVRKLS